MKRIAVGALLVLVVAGLAAALASRGPAPAATVEGEVISVQALRDRVRPLEDTAHFKEQLGQGIGRRRLRHTLEQRVLTQMIRERVLANAAETFNLSVSDRELRRYIEGIKRDREISSNEELRRLVESAGVSLPEWRRRMRFEVLAEKLSAHLIEEAEPSRAEALAYYRSHLADFSEARVQHILVRDAALAGKLWERLRSTPSETVAETFADLARRYSIDPSTAGRGGDFGFVAKGSFRIVLPPLDRAIDGLRTGAISRPVKSKLGFHIVRIAERRPRPLAAVRDEIDSLLREPEDPYRSFLRKAYGDVAVTPRFGRLDANFRVVDG